MLSKSEKKNCGLIKCVAPSREYKFSFSQPNPKERNSCVNRSAAPVVGDSHRHRERSRVVSVYMSSVFVSAFWHPVVRGFRSRFGGDSMVWYRICGSIAWVGASLDVGLDGFCASMVSLSIWFQGRWSLAVKLESEILLFVATPRVSFLCCVLVFSPRLVWGVWIGDQV